MTDNEIRATLCKWDAVMQQCDARMDQLSELFGHVVATPLGDAVYRVMDEYTRSVSEMIDFDFSALQAWSCEHEFGEKPMMAGFHGEKPRPIAAIDTLADFIIEYLRRGEL